MRFQMTGQHIEHGVTFLNSKLGTKTTIEFEAESLDDILEEFSMFLRGCGFAINGVLQIIPEEEYYGTNIRTDNSMD